MEKFAGMNSTAWKEAAERLRGMTGGATGAAGAFGRVTAAEGGTQESGTKRFAVISTEQMDTLTRVNICYDTQTGVMYMMARSGVTVMVDESGKPLIYKPEE